MLIARIILKVLPRFSMVSFELLYTGTPFADTSRSEAAVKTLGKILKN